MPAGGAGDAPLTDILHYKLPVYGEEADELIRKISVLSGARETNDWWETKIGWVAKPQDALIQARIRHAEIVQRATASHWELPDLN